MQRQQEASQQQPNQAARSSHLQLLQRQQVGLEASLQLDSPDDTPSVNHPEGHSEGDHPEGLPAIHSSASPASRASSPELSSELSSNSRNRELGMSTQPSDPSGGQSEKSSQLSSSEKISLSPPTSPRSSEQGGVEQGALPCALPFEGQLTFPKRGLRTSRLSRSVSKTAFSDAAAIDPTQQHRKAANSSAALQPVDPQPGTLTRAVRTTPAKARPMQTTVMTAARMAQRAALTDERVTAALSGPIDYLTAEARLHEAIATEVLPAALGRSTKREQSSAGADDRPAPQQPRLDQLSVVRVQKRTRKSLKTTRLAGGLTTATAEELREPSAHHSVSTDIQDKNFAANIASEARDAWHQNQAYNTSETTESTDLADPSPSTPLQLLGVALVFTCFLAAAVLL